MADMTFMLNFIANNAKAMEAIKQMQTAAKGEANAKVAADVAKVDKSMKNAAEAAKAQTKATKETQAATAGMASEGAKAEAAIRKTVEATKAGAAEAQTAARAAEETGRQEASRAEARMREIARRRNAYREFDREQNRTAIAKREPHWQDYWKARYEAEATAKAMKQAEAASRGSAAAQRELASATAKTGQEAAKVESRMGRIGQALRNVSWGRVAGNAAAELSKGIAKGVTDAVTAGLKGAASNAPSIFRGQSLMGGPAPGSNGPMGFVSGAIRAGFGVNQQQEGAVNAMRVGLTEEQSRAGARAAVTTAAATGNTIPLAEILAGVEALGDKGIIANDALLRGFADVHAGLRQQVAYGEIAKAYAAAAQTGNVERFLSAINMDTKVNEEGKRSVVYSQEGKNVERALPENDPGASVAMMNNVIARYAGQQARFQATPAGVQAQAVAQIQAGLGTIMEPSFKYITERLQQINSAMAGSGGAGSLQSILTGMGTQLLDGLRETERLTVSIATNVRDMAGPIKAVADSLGGWQVAIPALVALPFAGWLTAAAVGMAGLATASARFALSPIGGALTVAAAAGYLLKEAWSNEPPTPGSNKANAQAEVAAIKRTIADAWTWANTPLNREPTAAPGIPAASPGADAARSAPGIQEKQVQAVAVGEKAALALATIEAVAPAATAMVAEVTAILAGANFHSHGVAMMQTLAAGIRAGAAAAIGAVRETTQAMRDHLPHSPAKTGPLSDLDRIRFTETLAGAIRPGPAVAAVAAVAAGMRTMLPSNLAVGIGVGGVSGPASGGAATMAPALAAVSAITASMRAALPAGLAVGLGAGALAGPAAAGADAPVPPAIAGRAASAAAAGSSSLVYSPVIHLPAGADRADFARLLEEHKAQIEEMLERGAKRRSDLRFE